MKRREPKEKSPAVKIEDLSVEKGAANPNGGSSTFTLFKADGTPVRVTDGTSNTFMIGEDLPKP